MFYYGFESEILVFYILSKFKVYNENPDYIFTCENIVKNITKFYFF